MIKRQDSLKNSSFRICTKCIYDERVNGITFDEHGVCNYCQQIDQLKQEYGTGTSKGETQLAKIVNEIKSDGRGKDYDCVVGVSGGTIVVSCSSGLLIVV